METTEQGALAADVLSALGAQGHTLATAESLTGGRLGAALTAVPGASAVYVGGVVAYATRLKIALLDVPADLVETYGVVSAECAEAMALGVARRLGADVGVSTTGVAGPDLQEGKPAGLVYVGIAGPFGLESRELRLVGDRDEIRGAAVSAALVLLRERLAGIG